MAIFNSGSRFFPAVAGLGALLGAGFALGGGGAGVGNGGKVNCGPNGAPPCYLSDPYVVPDNQGTAIHYTDFNPNIRHELEEVGAMLVRLGAMPDQSPTPNTPPNAPPMTNNQKTAATEAMRLWSELSRTGQSDFIEHYVMDKDVTYHFVDDVKQLPAWCNSVATVSPPPGSDVELGGCTSGSDTYFVTSFFDNMPVNNGDATDPREQVEFIIHERMHVFDPTGEEISHISDVTDGIDLLLDLKHQQLTGKPPFPALTADQHQVLETLIERIGYSYNRLTLDENQKTHEFEDGGDWHISPQGGLYATYATLAPDAYLGVGSLLNEGGSLASGASMVNSSCYLSACTIDAGSSVVNTTIAPNVSSRPGAPQEQPNDDYEDELFTVAIGKNATVSGVTLKLDLPLGADGKTVTPDPTSVSIGDGASLQASEISAVTDLSVGQGAQLNGVILDFSVGDSASTEVDVANQAALSNLSTVVHTALTGGATARDLSFSGATLAFPKNQLACQPPEFPVLGGKAGVGAIADFASLCTNPLVPAHP